MKPFKRVKIMSNNIDDKLNCANVQLKLSDNGVVWEDVNTVNNISNSSHTLDLFQPSTKRYVRVTCKAQDKSKLYWRICKVCILDKVLHK